jgi:hypothetical protein
LKEKRVFKASSEFSKNANWNKKTVREYRALGAKNPQRFWAKMAKEHVTWFSPWKKVLDWKPPYAKWFVGGKVNVSYNCLDRHLEGENAWRRNKAAIIWEGEPGDTRTLTFGDLHREVCKFANVLKAQGVKKGDRVALYMPMIPELAIAILPRYRSGHPMPQGRLPACSERRRLPTSPSCRSVPGATSQLREQRCPARNAPTCSPLRQSARSCRHRIVRCRPTPVPAHYPRPAGTRTQ